MQGKQFLRSTLKDLLFISPSNYDVPLHLHWATIMKPKGWLEYPIRNRGDFRAFR